MQVIGICRFSWPGSGGFQVEHATLADRIAYLYAPDRLEERFRLFECLTLPALRAQTDPDFAFLVVIGETLPEIWRRRLDDLLHDLPQAIVLARPPGPHRAAMQAAINTVRKDTGEPCLQFRLDDDDAVAVDFVSALRQSAQASANLLAEHRHVAIDFNRGFIARPGPSGIEAAPIHEPLWTAGLALMFRTDVDLSVMNFAHHRVGRHMPVISHSDRDMMLRGFNRYNDSRQKPEAKTHTLSLLDAAGEAHFEDRFAVSGNHVRLVFSGP